MNRFKRNKDLIDASTKDYLKSFSPMLTLNSKYNELGLQHFSKGLLLDAGAGNQRNRPIAVKYCDRYESLDMNADFEGLDHIANLQDMREIPSEHYDTVLMTHVVEHLTRPDVALTEVRRVLKPDGVLIGSTPHLSRLHGVPHDYYRFTSFGLIYMLRDEAKFNEWAVFPVGGAMSFLGHQFCTLLVCSTLHIPILGHAIARINRHVIVPSITGLDKVLGAKSWLPFMYMFVATSEVFTQDQRDFLKQMPGAILSIDDQSSAKITGSAASFD